MNTNLKKNNQGFIANFLVIIVLIVILHFLGFNIKEIWENIFYPFFVFLGGLIEQIIDFAISIATKLKSSN